MHTTALPSGTPVSLITHADALAPGTRLAEFELQGALGAGGFGMVYQAFDHSLQRPVAIKEYLPAALAGRGQDGAVIVRDPADQPAFAAGLQSFVAEARLLAQFDHPSLVRVFRYREDNQTAYMVMPLYRGMTLQAARTQMRSPPTEAWLRKVLWAVLGALKTLHHGSAVHRDVSPDNIFLQDNGPPVLLDLGAARHAIGGKTQDLTDALKLSYAPLEQHPGAPEMRQGPWTDLYALAAVVHGLLCNKPPLPATLRAVRDRLPPFERVARTVQEQFGLTYSPAFVQAIGQALAIAPKNRPQTVAALVQAMGLETPNGMSRFDWRGELGAIWVPPVLSVPQQANAQCVRTRESAGAGRRADAAFACISPPARRTTVQGAGCIGTDPVAHAVARRRVFGRRAAGCRVGGDAHGPGRGTCGARRGLGGADAGCRAAARAAAAAVHRAAAIDREGGHGTERCGGYSVSGATQACRPQERGAAGAGPARPAAGDRGGTASRASALGACRCRHAGPARSAPVMRRQ
ncbi:serine/threonine-protein kinase [Polaromonas eurypsychrophila]|uniref:Protein kinase domain-containing protein n=1 Tax=Polaromonas eurypsychrophila TaxID=1614635 RepID=A0A916SD42_9BURK|nr:hypothetical protein GCM10011496_13200 [Polaromonas eurypsychrophila]